MAPPLKNYLPGKIPRTRGKNIGLELHGPVAVTVFPGYKQERFAIQVPKTSYISK